MSFYRSKRFWIASIILAALLLVWVNDGVKVMTSVFKNDLGIRYGGSHFKARAKPYDPDTYVDYAKALKRALTSCPVLQQEHLPITDAGAALKG